MNVLITGSSKGLGRSLSLKFSSEGYGVILHGRNQEDLDRVKAVVLGKGVNCDVVRGDITLPKTLDRLYKMAAKKGIDVLINNAGVCDSKPFWKMSPEEIRNIMEVNLIAPIELIHKVFPLFLNKRSGVIININSLAVKHPSEFESVYCASKHGLNGFTQALQLESQKYNLRIINVYIGAMNTSMAINRKNRDKLISTVDVAETIYGLCKDYPSMIVTEVEMR